jgi:hypothetical protein
VESLHGSLTAGQAEAFPFAGGASGATGAVHVYIDSRNTARTLIVALYTNANGHPGSLLSAGSLSSPQAGAWDTATVAPIQVEPGTTYWLVVLGTGGTLRYRVRARGPCKAETSAQANLLALTAVWRTGTLHSTCPISAYVTPATSTLPVGGPEPVELTPEPVEFTPPTESPPLVEPAHPIPPAAPTAPVNSAPPTIGGTVTEGRPLTATAGAWTGSPTSYAYQWQDCNAAGASCANVSGASASSYTLGSSDVGHTVSVVVTASNAGGAASAASASVGPVSAPPPPPVEPPSPFRFFSPTSFWNEQLPADAPLDPNSAAIVGAFVAEIEATYTTKGWTPKINTTSYSVPIYTVPQTQPTVKVTYEIPYEGHKETALEAAWAAVPLPAGAKPAKGTDRDLVVWQPSTDRLWEFWGLEETTEGWLAKWGGAMQSASSDPGVYGPEAWPGATTGWGAAATHLSYAGGLITLEDLERGQINHALAIAIPNAREAEYASPATGTDGYSSSSTSLPEGAHLRLDPNLDLASLHLPRLTLMMAEAAQKYGIFVRDSSTDVAFVAQDPTPTGTNPYTGAGGYFEGKSENTILASFPWSHLQLLKMELHS